MEKNRILSHSLNNSPSLFDTPGTEALTLRKIDKSNYARRIFDNKIIVLIS